MKNNKLTTEQRNEELKKERKAEKEISHVIFNREVEEVMEKVEGLRYERKEEARISNSETKRYTQEGFAEGAGILLSTSKNYRYGRSDTLKLKTLFKIVDILQCSMEDVLPQTYMKDKDN